MIARMSFLMDGSQSIGEEERFETSLLLGSNHVQWLRGLLRESPADFDVFVAQTEQGTLRLEWRCVLQGAGMAYLALEGQMVAACLVLEGRILAAERAATDALQASLPQGSTPALRQGFAQVRNQLGKPMRALFVTSAVEAKLLSHLQYWADCVAAARLDSIPVERERNGAEGAESQNGAEAVAPPDLCSAG